MLSRSKAPKTTNYSDRHARKNNGLFYGTTRVLTSALAIILLTWVP